MERIVPNSGNQEPVSGLLAGEIVVLPTDSGLYDAQTEGFSAELRQKGIGARFVDLSYVPPDHTEKAISTQPNPSLLMVVSHVNQSGIDSTEEIQRHAGEFGLRGVIIGDREAVHTKTPPHPMDQEVTEWDSHYGKYVVSEYLEEVAVSNKSLRGERLLTDSTIKTIFREVFSDIAGTEVSASSIYNRAVTFMTNLRPYRQYLQSGTVYLGERKKQGQQLPRSYWGITPGALHALVEEDARDLKQPFGTTSRNKMQNVLSYLTRGNYPSVPVFAARKPSKS